jgi:signal transduction histidine kinase
MNDPLSSHTTYREIPDNPAATIRPDGTLLDITPSGKPYWERLQQSGYPVSLFVEEMQPFVIFPETTLRLDGIPDEKGETLRLTWQELSPADVQLALLRLVSRSVNASLMLPDIFDALGDVLRRFIPYQTGTLVILDESQNLSRVVVSLDQYGQADIQSNRACFVGDDPVMDRMLKYPQPGRLTAPMEASILLPPGHTEVLLAPLVSKGMLIGMMSLAGSAYSSDHLQLLAIASEQLALAVENARLYWQTQEQAGRSFLINQITTAIRQSLDIDRILETTARELGQVMGLSRCRIHYLLHPSHSEASDEVYRHVAYVLPGTPPIKSPECLARMEQDCFLTRQDDAGRYNPFILNDTHAVTPMAPYLADADIRSLAIVPIVLEEQHLVGTISLHQCGVSRTWLDEEIALLQAISGHVAVALHQSQLFEETETRRCQLQAALDELNETQMHLIQSEKMAVLGQFVAGIAHEVNTPLGTLMSNDDTVRCCLEQLAVEGDANTRFRESALALLAINRMAGVRIQEIVRNLRNFARLDESDLQRVDLHAGLETTLILLETSFKGQIQVVRHYGEIPPIECFPGLLNQVFMNMLINAAHSMESSAKRVMTLTTCYDPIADRVDVLLADTGKGISAEHLPRIFDPGFTTKGVGVGTGLGLALCYKIIEKHQGRIEVSSVVAEGSTFRVILPVLQRIHAL